MKELQLKIRNRLLIIALILLACALLQSSLTLAACDSFEPYGSCPDVNLAIRPSVGYINNVTYSNSTSGTGIQVYFKYIALDGHENITYTLNNKANGTCYTPISSPTNIASNNTCFEIRHDYDELVDGVWTRQNQTNITKPTKLDLRFEWWNTNLSRWQFNWSFEANVRTEFANPIYNSSSGEIIGFWMMQNNTLLGTTTEWEGINWSITIKGKSLIAQAQGQRGRFYQWNWDSTETANNIPISIVKMDNNSVDMMLTADFMIVAPKTFYRLGTIYDKSDMTTYENSAGLTKTNNTKVNNANTAFYHNLTGCSGAPALGSSGCGKKNNMSETFVITVSKNAYDVMLYNNNTVSPYYDTLKNEWTYEYWASNGSANRSQIYNETLRLANYGMTLSTANLRMYSMASGNPGRWNFSGTSSDIAQQVYDFGVALGNLGIRLYYYNSLQDGEPGDIFTIDQNTYFGTTTYAANYSYLSQNRNGNNETSFGNDAHIAYCMRQNMLNTVLLSNASRWASTGMYLDTEGANLIQNYYDARSNTSYAENGRKRMQMICQRNYSSIIHNAGFAITTENQGAFYSAGSMDQGEAALATSSGGSMANKGLMPSWYINSITEKMVVIDEGLRRCMFNWNDTNKWKYGVYGSDETQFQRCFTRARALRATTHLDGFTYDLHNVPDNLTIQMYYLSYELGKLMYAGDLKNETYQNQSNGAWMDLSTALAQGYDWKNASFHQEYTNGLHLYINLRSQSNHWLNITANGATRNIAQNGFYAYMEDGSFEEFYNDNNQSHWVKTSSYIYVYPKTSSVTLSGLGLSYYEPYAFYSSEQTNGLRSLGIVEPTTNYTATQPVLLYQRTYSESQSDLAELTTGGHFCARIFKGFELIILAIMVAVAIAIIFIIKNTGQEIGGLPQLFMLAIIVGIMVIVAIMIVGAIGGGYCG